MLHNIKLKNPEKLTAISYTPTEEERKVRSRIVTHFGIGYVASQKPRVEFDDLSLAQRATIDKLSYNTYQPNNGRAIEGDIVNRWRSNAVRPVVRNKIVSMAAHATNAMLYPGVKAFNEDMDYDDFGAQAMQDLIEFSCIKSNYDYHSMQMTITSLFSPAAIMYTEYAMRYRMINGQTVPDEAFTGFTDTVVPVTEIYISNFYEHDIQKQDWIIWRRTPTYDSALGKYGNLPNWQYVRPGVQIVFNDANNLFYEAYDADLRGELVEEVLYWNRARDEFIIMVNGVMLTPHNNPNPRLDKQYPFTKTGYEFLDEGRFFYYKSLAHKMQKDAEIINTVWPMYIDAQYMSMFPPLQNIGGEMIGSNVAIPGTTINLTGKDSVIKPIFPQMNLSGSMQALGQIEQSISQTSESPVFGQAGQGPNQTAEEIRTRRQQLETVLGLFIRMLMDFVDQYGKLRISDIVQHLTVAKSAEITGDKLAYQAFILPALKGVRQNAKQLKFDGETPDMSSEMDQMMASAELAKNKNTEIWSIHPKFFRELMFETYVTKDRIMPLSETEERGYVLEEYDRLIANPLTDQEAALKMLLEAYPKTHKNVDQYIVKQQPQAQQQPMQGQTSSATQPQQQITPRPGATMGVAQK